MSVLSNRQIWESIANGHIICHPFNQNHLAYTSLDVTLGYYFYRVEAANKRTVHNPLDREDVERYFDGPYKAMPHAEWCALNGLKPVAGIPEKHPVIALHPGERILAHTHEFLGIRAPGAGEIKGHDNWSRSGISVTLDGGWIGPDATNRLTLTIHNLNQHETILLPVGERVAQVVFHETGAVDTRPNSQNLEALVRTWSPSLMLPQAWKDQRSLPQKVEGLSYE